MSLTLAAPFIFHLFDGTGALTDFRDRAIGETTLQGVDASGYARGYVAMTVTLALSFFFLYAALTALDRFLRKKIDPETLRGEYSGIERLSELAVALFLMWLIVRADFAGTLLHLIYGFIGVLFALIGVKHLLKKRGGFERARALLEDRHCLLAFSLLPFPFLFAYQVAFEKSLGFSGFSLTSGVSLYLLAWIALIAASSITFAWGVTDPSEIRAKISSGSARLLFAATPLLMIPLSIPLANELQYGFPDRTPRAVSLTIMAVLGAFSASLFLLYRRREVPIRPGRLVSYVFFPLFVATLTVFRVHRHTRSVGTLDYFHTGEFTVPTQQLFHFGSIPLIDLRPAHTLSDLFYQSLYTLCFGFRGLDMQIWTGWMPHVVAFLILYFFLARLVSPVFALGATTLTPLLGTVSTYYSYALLPALFLGAALRRPSVARFCGVWASAFGLTLWRFDFGMVCWVSLALILGVEIVRRPYRLRTLLLSGAIVGASVLIILSILAFLSHRPVFESLFLLVKSYTFRLATRTRSDIIHSYSTVAVLQYYFLPAVSLAYILYFAVRRLIRGTYLSPKKYMLIYVAIFSLVISLRSLERHSLVEGFNPYFFIFLLALFPFLLMRAWRGRESPGRRAAFLAVLVLFSFFWLPPSSYARSRLYHLFKSGEVFQFHDWEKDERRISYNAAPHEDLVRFLNDQLEGEETFFDFTNSPLLYLFTDKRFPTYVIPNIVHTSETVQGDVAADFESLLAEDRLPFVIFKQGNRFWDNVDQVPNEIRSYRIAELIYRHYAPLVRIAKYEVWGRRDLEDPDSLFERYRIRHVLEPFSEARVHDLSSGPGEGERPEDVAPLVMKTTGQDPYIVSPYRLDELPPLSSARLWHLRLRYRSTASGLFQVFFKSDLDDFSEEISSWTTLSQTPPGSSHEVLLPVRTSLYASRLTDLRFDPPAESEVVIERAEIVRDLIDWAPLAEEPYTQHFQLQRLPYVWGQHDPLSAASRAEVEAELLREPAALASEEELSLEVDGAIEKMSGHYLKLRMRPAVPHLPELSEIRVVVEYGEPPPSRFELELVPGPQNELERVLLPLLADEPKVHQVSSFQMGDRTIFRSQGEDPYFHGILDVEGLGEWKEEEDHFLLLQYRSSAAGELQIFFGFDWHWFEGGSKVAREISAIPDGKEPGRIVVPIPVAGDPVRLTDVRFDIPRKALFEVVGVEVVRQKRVASTYLIRLSTQWEWMSQDVEELRVRASAPIVLEQALLLRGD